MLTPDRQELVTGCLDLAWQQACLYRRGTRLPLDDLYQEAVLGLCAAASRFDASRGTRFSTYAFWMMKGRLVKFAMASARHNRHREASVFWDSVEDRNAGDPCQIAIARELISRRFSLVPAVPPGGRAGVCRRKRIATGWAHLSGGECRVLAVLSHGNTMATGGIAAAAGVEVAYCHKVMSVLGRGGYVKRAGRDGARGQVLYQMTEKARRERTSPS